MIYKEYLTKIKNKERKLGIFGEVHIYNKKESQFAEYIVPKYDIIGLEACSYYDPSLINALSFFNPSQKVYCKATNRSEFNINVRSLAIRDRKEIYLEPEFNEMFPSSQKLALSLSGLINSLFLPFHYLYLKLKGDPYEFGTNAYKTRIEKEKNGKTILITKLFCLGISGNIDRRDKAMADNSLDILYNNKGSLLINCGLAHFDGVYKNLSEKIKLKEVDSFIL